MLRAFKRVCKGLKDGSKNVDPAFEPIVWDGAKLDCPKCKARRSMVAHGSYHRHYVSIDQGVVSDTLIEILRLRCTSCKSTHALMPPTAIPYCVFSIRFVATLICDWADNRFSSIEALCAHYGIAISTFYRMSRHFSVCARLISSVCADTDDIVRVARLLKGRYTDASDGFLSGFYDMTATSFCQARSP
jgi:transposase-like protein